MNTIEREKYITMMATNYYMPTNDKMFQACAGLESKQEINKVITIFKEERTKELKARKEGKTYIPVLPGPIVKAVKPAPVITPLTPEAYNTNTYDAKPVEIKKQNYLIPWKDPSVRDNLTRAEAQLKSYMNYISETEKQIAGFKENLNVKEVDFTKQIETILAQNIYTNPVIKDNVISFDMKRNLIIHEMPAQKGYELTRYTVSIEFEHRHRKVLCYAHPIDVKLWSFMKSKLDGCHQWEYNNKTKAEVCYGSNDIHSFYNKKDLVGALTFYTNILLVVDVDRGHISPTKLKKAIDEYNTINNIPKAPAPKSIIPKIDNVEIVAATTKVKKSRAKKVNEEDIPF